jgi:serine protease Do
MKTVAKINFKVHRIYFLVSLLLVQACQAQDKKNEKDIESIQKSAIASRESISYSGNVDFKFAAKVATPGVVHIKCTFKAPKNDYRNDQEDFYNMPDALRDFFKDDPFFRQFKFRLPQSEPHYSEPYFGSASGVILTPNGYIITNNHVVKNADEIEVTLFDGHSYPAKIIGNDPQTDLALLKIDEKELSFILFGDSDKIEVGEWVVAVGNPFNLASTVTVGIVSAKARNINILSDQGAIESFIQTDAAVNPGNSGGALVTLEGKLIGINTAIATPTGVYAGYAFAIPVDIVKKVANDLMNFGAVQRGVLGIAIRDMDSNLAKEMKSNRANGVYVDSVAVKGAAKEAGIKAKDIIISIDNIETLTTSKLQEIIMRKQPGDKVKIGLIRNGNEQKELIATLKKLEETSKITNTGSKTLLKDLGIEVAVITAEDQKKYKVKNGVKITKLYNGKLRNLTDIREGFVITSVNNKAIYSVKDLLEAIEIEKEGIMLQGKYAGDNTTYYYAFGK